MAVNIDLLRELPPLAWRDIEVPAQTNSVSFQHGLVDHRQHGVDGAHVENTGRGSMVISFRIPFRLGLLDYSDLYPTRFRDFWNACLDGTTGNLKHPEFGEFDAKVESFTLTVTPEMRDGYDVDVVFRETTENEITAADNPLGPIVNAVAIMEAIQPTFPVLLPTPEYDDGKWTNPLQALKSLQGQLMLLEMTVVGKISQINNVMNAINDMIDTVNYASEPEAWEVSKALKDVWTNLLEAKDALSPTQDRIDFVVAPRELGVAEAAASASMELDDFFKLNPRLARVSAIDRGEEYFVKVKA